MKKILLSLVMIMLVGCSNSKDLYKTITGEEVKGLINNNEVIIIDVRSSSEYEVKHIEESINIPLDTISKSELENVVDNYESSIVVYCQSGNRSRQAVELLNNLGYTNVYDLGSIDNWSTTNE